MILRASGSLGLPACRVTRPVCPSPFAPPTPVTTPSSGRRSPVGRSSQSRVCARSEPVSCRAPGVDGGHGINTPTRAVCVTVSSGCGRRGVLIVILRDGILKRHIICCVWSFPFCAWPNAVYCLLWVNAAVVGLGWLGTCYGLVDRTQEPLSTLDHVIICRQLSLNLCPLHWAPRDRSATRGSWVQRAPGVLRDTDS